MRMMLFRRMILLLGVCGVVVVKAADDSAAEYEWTMGVAATRPVALTMANFERAIEDPANPFWLLKFYAPWCGHCKRMIPVLDAVAPKVAGKMSIGKIDCTVHKKLCDQYKVRGYPTMKFSLDGTVHEYSGGRSEPDIQVFAKKMTRPVLSPVNSVTAAYEFAHKESDSGVVFLAMDPKLEAPLAAGQDVSSATLLTQVLAQVARKYRATAEFLVVVPDETTAEQDASLSPTLASTLSTGPYICRLERFVPVKCFTGVLDGEINSVDLTEFIDINHVATVTQLGPSNFQAMSRKGRPLVIGVVRRRSEDEERQQVDAMEEALVKLATQEPYRSKYYFGWMDGGQFYRFLEQFTIDKEKDLPTVFVLDQTSGVFWQNSTYFTGSFLPLEESAKLFLNHIADGTIPEQVTKAGTKGWKRVLNRLVSAMNEYHPWSIILLVLVLVAFALAIAAVASPGEPIAPLPPSKKKKKSKAADDDQPSTAMPDLAEAGKQSKPDEVVAEEKEEESKKDK